MICGMNGDRTGEIKSFQAISNYIFTWLRVPHNNYYDLLHFVWLAGLSVFALPWLALPCPPAPREFLSDTLLMGYEKTQLLWPAVDGFNAARDIVRGALELVQVRQAERTLKPNWNSVCKRNVWHSLRCGAIFLLAQLKLIPCTCCLLHSFNSPVCMSYISGMLACPATITHRGESPPVTCAPGAFQVIIILIGADCCCKTPASPPLIQYAFSKWRQVIYDPGGGRRRMLLSVYVLSQLELKFKCISKRKQGDNIKIDFIGVKGWHATNIVFLFILLDGWRLCCIDCP